MIRIYLLLVPMLFSVALFGQFTINSNDTNYDILKSNFYNNYIPPINDSDPDNLFIQFKRFESIWDKRIGNNEGFNKAYKSFRAISDSLNSNTPVASRSNTGQYISNWVEVLKGDTKAIFTAASLATRTVDYLIGLQPKPAADTDPGAGPAPAAEPSGDPERPQTDGTADRITPKGPR